jgi:septal ring factor EnvC (AmiA/AmiB activator)
LFAGAVITRIALGLCLVLGATAWWQSLRASGLSDDLSAARSLIQTQERQIDDARQTAAVLDAHIERMQEQRRELDASIQALRKKEGYDATLSDFLGDVFDSL